MARFVLVHGAFSGAWVWEPVADRLREAGHTVDAIDLPGSGDDQTPAEEVTLDAYAARICDALAEHEEPAILVGHSMGGVAITHAAGRCPARISLLVYVSAFMPQHGQSLLDLTHTPEGEGDQVQANLVVDGDPPLATLPAAVAPAVLYGSCTDEQAAWATTRMRPQPLAPFAAPVDIEDPRSQALPRAYVTCNQDRAIPPALQRRMINETPCVEVIEFDTDHSPWLSKTDELVKALARLAEVPARSG
ncbi:MAG TPA: alpha/beta fold hydrolase [Thermoleophilaceae bacterium]|nr:alpha/beta fold hydrolase [Thermoleophilaceae bacterium]